MKEKEIELLPCPFCNGDAKIADGTTMFVGCHWVICSSCGSQTAMHYLSVDGAVAIWNARTATAREARLVEALEKIRDMDYRGNRHSSADIASEALAEYRGEK